MTALSSCLKPEAPSPTRKGRGRLPCTNEVPSPGTEGPAGGAGRGPWEAQSCAAGLPHTPTPREGTENAGPPGCACQRRLASSSSPQDQGPGGSGSSPGGAGASEQEPGRCPCGGPSQRRRPLGRAGVRSWVWGGGRACPAGVSVEETPSPRPDARPVHTAVGSVVGLRKARKMLENRQDTAGGGGGARVCAGSRAPSAPEEPQPRLGLTQGVASARPRAGEP